ncbi:MAG: hypothetical protein U9O94_01455 [Nanoarchaeota archaeon]|nr:hypothetical protein [Nanoarchaeota archaeon]
MLKRLLILSLIAIPFYEVFLYFLIPGREFPFFPDMRVTKDFMAMGFSMIIGSVAFYRYGFRKFENKWILAFLIFLVWNIAKAPGSFPVSGVEMAGLWNYKSAYQLMVFFFLFCGISNIPNLNIKDILKTMAWCGFAMAVLMALQRVNLDQIFSLAPKEIIKATKLPQMGGSIGSTATGTPFLVMTIPFMLYLRKWLYAAFMAIVVVFAGSSFAMLGLCSVLFVEVVMAQRIKWYYLTIGSIAIAFLVGVFIYFNQDFLVSNGRFPVWQRTIKDVFEGRIAYTGAGIGAFKYLSAIKHGDLWRYAHNDYLQLVWSCGIIGAGITLMAVKTYIHKILDKMTSENKAIFASCFGIGVISCGNFPLQLAVYQYYLIVMAGIIYIHNSGGNYGTKS